MLKLKHIGEFSKFRSGTALIAIETRRYKQLNVIETKCFNCQESVEDEVHIITLSTVHQAVQRAVQYSKRYTE